MIKHVSSEIKSQCGEYKLYMRMSIHSRDTATI